MKDNKLKNYLILGKKGRNTVRLFPTTQKELDWESKPDEIILEQRNETDKEILSLYQDYEIIQKGKRF